MPRLRTYAGALALIIAADPVSSLAQQTIAADSPSTAPSSPTATAFANLPLAFEPNLGQFDRRVRFLARGRNGTAFITDEGLVFTRERRIGGTSLEPEARDRARPGGKRDGVALELKFLASRHRDALEGVDPLPGRSNYLIGNKPKRWHTDVPRYARVVWHGAYPGIDVAYYQGKGGIEYDLIAAPGADPTQVRLALEGADRVELASDGDLVLHTALGEVRQRKPVVYQGERSAAELIAGRYRLIPSPHGAEVAFDLGSYDPDRALVLDPSLDWGTYFGGSQYDVINGIAVDADSNAYLAGSTQSDATTFPETAGAYLTTKQPFTDGFVAKISADGTQLIYATYLGGNGNDNSNAIAVDANGQAAIGGETSSTNFPTAGAVQGTNPSGGTTGTVTKLNAAGNGLVFSTYLGGTNGTVEVFAIAVDAGLSTYVTGWVIGATNFPTGATPSPFQSAIGGSGLSNSNAFAVKYGSNGARVYGTLLGSGNERGNGIAADSTGSAYVIGTMVLGAINGVTANVIGPGTNVGNGEVMIAKLNPAGSALAYLTRVGSSGTEEGTAGAVDANGNLFFTGRSYYGLAAGVNSDLPSNPLAPKNTNVALFGALNAAGTALTGPGLTWYGNATATSCSAFTFGALGSGIALDPTENAAYVAGYGCPASKFPAVNPAPGLSCSPNCPTNTDQIGSFLLRYTYSAPASPLAGASPGDDAKAATSASLEWAEALAAANAEYYLQAVAATIAGNVLWGGSTPDVRMLPNGVFEINNGGEDGTVLKVAQAVKPPEVSKSFIPPATADYQIVAMPIQIKNPNESTTLTHVSVNDQFPDCLQPRGLAFDPPSCRAKLGKPMIGNTGGPDSAGILVGTTKRPVTLGPGETCTVVVFFSPQPSNNCVNQTNVPLSDQAVGVKASATLPIAPVSTKNWGAQNPQKAPRPATPDAVASPSMSDGANWVGGVAPADGDNVTFSGTATQLAVTNDLPVNQTLNLVTLSGAGYSLGGSALNLKAGIRDSGATNLVSAPVKAVLPISLTSVSGTSVLNLSGGIDLNGNDIHFAGAGAISVSGAIGGAGDVYASGTGDVTLSTAPTFAGNLFVQDGRLFANAAVSQPIDVSGLGVLRGSGPLSGVTLDDDGVIAPGTSAAPASFSLSSLSVDGGTVELTFSAGNATHGALIASGPVQLGAGLLKLDLTATPSVGTLFTNLITAPGTITGCFPFGLTNLPDVFVVPECTASAVSALVVNNGIFSSSFETP